MGRRMGERSTLLAGAVPAALILMAALAACGSAPGRGAAGRSTSASSGPTSSAPATGAMPAYFVDDVQSAGAVSGGILQVRSSVTGRLADSPPIQALAVAPLSAPGTFAIARLLGQGCATALYRITLSAAGIPGPLIRFGPAIRGQVVAMATDADGGVIGYTAQPCGSKSATGAAPAGYLGVLGVRSGTVRSFGSVDVYGTGSISAASLSLSADGGLLAFAGAITGTGGSAVERGVWLLRTTSPAGTLRERGRLVLASPAAGPVLASAILSPDGASFDLCDVTTSQTAPTDEIAAYRTSSGQLEQVIASLAGNVPAFGLAPLYCPIAASSGDRYLLAPYWLRADRAPPFAATVRVARIDLMTGAIARLSFRLPGSGGMSVADGLTVAW